MSETPQGMNVPQFLYAFFAFYASIPTLFVPLTFSLIASVKQQYVAALQNKSLAPRHDRIFLYQDAFFYWNDAFASAVVASSIVALAIIVMSAIRFADSLSIDHDPLRWVALVAACFSIVATVVVLRHSPLRRDQRLGSASGPHWFAGVVFGALSLSLLLSGCTALTEFLEVAPLGQEHAPQALFTIAVSILCGATAVYLNASFPEQYKNIFPRRTTRWRSDLINAIPADDKHLGAARAIRKRTCHLAGLTCANILLVVGALINSFVAGNGGAYSVSGALLTLAILLTIHVFCLVLLWWHLYQVWYPFTYLREMEAAPLSPKWRNLFRSLAALQNGVVLSVGAVLQWRAFRTFMYQYEDDDVSRLTHSKAKYAIELMSTGSREIKKSEAIAKWSELISGKEAGCLYIGCGYGEWLDAAHTLLSGTSSRTIWLNDIHTLGAPTANEQDDASRLARREVLMTSHIVHLPGDIFAVLGIGMPAEPPAPNIEAVLSASVRLHDAGVDDALRAQSQAFRAAFIDVKPVAVDAMPTLLVIANNTYGQLLSPVHDVKSDVSELPLDVLAKSSRQMFLMGIRERFANTGFLLVVHCKVSLASVADAGAMAALAPYTESWIELQGTQKTRGLFVIGRWPEGDDEVLVPMFSEWLSEEELRAELDTANVCASGVIGEVEVKMLKKKCVDSPIDHMVGLWYVPPAVRAEVSVVSGD